MGILFALGALTLFLMVGVASADTLTINFDTYTLGSINGQDGWSATGASYDQAVVTSGGGRALRVSNAVTSGSFGDWIFSKSLVNEAGETSAMNDGFSGGTRQSHFTAQWDFASTVPGAEQPGLQVSAAPDRGDGARMSYIRMTDTPSGLSVFFDDFTGDGSCGTGATFNETTVASGLSRTVPHTIKLDMAFVDGPANDHVKVYVDGQLVHKGTSWEDYFRECEPNPTRTVDSLIIQARSGSGTAPATLGYGFVIDNLTLTSDMLPGDPKVGGIVVDPDTSALALQTDSSSGSNTWLLTGGLAVAAISVITLGGGAWYVRRRRVQ